MPIDPRIALGVQPIDVPSPMENFGKALSLRSLLDQRDMHELQKQRFYQALQKDEERTASLRQLVSGLPADEQAAAMFSPEKFIEGRYGAYSLRPGEQRMAGGQVIAQAPDRPVLATVGVEGQPGATQSAWAVPGGPVTPIGAPKLPVAPRSELQTLLVERDALSPTDPKRAIYNQKIQKLTTHQPAASTTVNIAGKEADKAYGKFVGEQFADIQKAGLSAPSDIGRYQQLGNLLGQVNTGRFAGTTVDLKAAAKGLGINVESLGIKDDVAPAQAAKSLSAQMALELRNPAGGAGMPGAMSDKDREFLQSMIPNIENDPKAIGMMIDARVRMARRNQQVAAMAREYAVRKGGGNIDNGFFEELQQFSNANPLFPEANKPSAPRVRRFNPQTGRIE